MKKWAMLLITLATLPTRSKPQDSWEMFKPPGIPEESYKNYHSTQVVTIEMLQNILVNYEKKENTEKLINVLEQIRNSIEESTKLISEIVDHGN